MRHKKQLIVTNSFGMESVRKPVNNVLQRMVHSCNVSGCYNRSNTEMELLYFGLLLTNKKLLKLPVKANYEFAATILFQ